ncbi:hypothetical protein [Methylorubrum populi]|uniref:Urea amidohydrolase (Urease) alpha subunit n=1 Tax=Methylorubrum populi TaxID=223967 RepID=A0A833JC05_9HYPH|nr:hypothetical protein [Methylorubrum populi]KAB7787513.1 Urea amidohydrolase (urease) alpha subunit [Methylorubrum populi]
MSFLLRAALVIGALSYLALQRQGGLDPARLQAAAAGNGTGIGAGRTMGDAMDRLTTGGIGALVNALPPETRAEMARAGADAVARHVAGQLAPPRPSVDTLSASDRQPPWRGAISH